MERWENVYDLTTESTDAYARAWAHRSGPLQPAGITVYIDDRDTGRDYSVTLTLSDVLSMIKTSVGYLEEEVAENRPEEKE